MCVLFINVSLFFFEIIEYIKKLEYETSIIINGLGDIFSYYPDLIEYLKTLKNSNLKQVTFETNTSLLNGTKILELKKYLKKQMLNMYLRSQ